MNMSDSVDGNSTFSTMNNWSVSPTDMRRFAVAMYSVMLPLVLTVGIFGNVITLIVLVKLRQRTSTVNLLVALTTSDLLFLLVITFFVVVQNFILYQHKIGNLYKQHMFHVLRVSKFPCRLSKMVTMLIVVERVFAVYRPLAVRRIWTRSASVVTLVSLSVVTFAVNVPTMLPFEFSQSNHSGTTYSIALQEIRLHQSDYENLHIVCSVLFSVVPVLTVAVCNVAILFGLRHHRRKKLGRNVSLWCLTNRQRQENKITRMLLGISLMYCVFSIPYETLLLFMILDTEGYIATYDNNNMRLAVMVAYLFVVINSSINFCVYVTSNSVYRQRYRKLVCCCCDGSDNYSSNTNSNTFTQIDRIEFDVSVSHM